MPRIEIRDVPADVYAAYERRAAAMGQSLEEYLRAELSRNVGGTMTTTEWVAEVDAWRAASPDGFLTDERPIWQILDEDADHEIDRRRRERPD